jgi:hypothetical protein
VENQTNENLTGASMKNGLTKTEWAMILTGPVVMGLLAILLLAVVLVNNARGGEGVPIGVVTGHADGSPDVVVTPPEWGYDFGTLVRSDERGTAWAGVRYQGLTVLGGGDGLLTDHDNMRFWMGGEYRLRESGVAFGGFVDIDGPAAFRLTWWPSSDEKPIEFASLWAEVGGKGSGGTFEIVMRFGVDVALPFDTHFEPGVSLTYGTDQALGMDLFLRFPIDAGLAVQGGMILLDGPDLPVWWRRANGDGFTGYLSLTWRG